MQLIEWANRHSRVWATRDNKLVDATFASYSQEAINLSASFNVLDAHKLLYRIAPYYSENKELNHVAKLCVSLVNRLPFLPSSQHLDPRGCFVLVTRFATIAWIGQRCTVALKNHGMKYAKWMRSF